MKGPIRRIPRERVESREDTRLPTAWIGLDTPTTAPPGLVWLSRGPQHHDSASSEAPVLVMLGPEEAEALPHLLAHARTGARVYVLSGPTWGKAQVDAQIVHAPRVLIRRVPEVPTTAVLTASGSRVWLGGGWSLRLGHAQAEALRQTFLRLFWHEATEEAWSGGPQLAWRAAGDRPFDIPELLPAAAVRLCGADARLEGEVRGATVHLATGAPPEAAPARLCIPAGGNHHGRLATLARGGTEVTWLQRGLPDLILGSGSQEALLPGTRARLRIRLSPIQVTEVGRVLGTPAQWTFQTDVRLGDPSLRHASVWLSGEAEARRVEAEQVIEVADVAAPTLRATPDATPTTTPAAQPLALTARYRWTVVPPRLPAGTEEDALVGRWRKVDDDWSTRVARVREALEAAQGDRGRIGKAFSRLMSAMLGFERTHGGLLAQVATMETQLPSDVGPEAAPRLLARLAEIEDQTRKLQGDQEDAERKAREDEEREKQEKAWRARVDAALRDLPGRRASLAKAEAERQRIAEALAATAAAIKSADADGKKDLTARQQKLSDDFARATKEINRLSAEVSSLERQTEERFEFRPPATPAARPATPGGRFVPPSAAARPASVVPEDALPEVGALRSQKGQRYLVIQTWEELAKGEQAANRLSAKLVAPENA